MSRRNGRPTLVILLVVGGLCVATALARTALAQDEKGGENGERDPFSPSGKLQVAQGAERGDFVPTGQTDALPDLALRGYIEDKAGNRVALLEVAGAATYLVREGDTVSLSRRRGNVVLRVTEVGNLALLVEIGELRQVVVVR